jgi:uncharacterized protein (DUF1697 family)
MPRYAAFLRAVSPMNAKMSDLRAAFEDAGFTDVKTVASSGNVVFTAAKSSEASLERKAEAAMERRLGSSFLTIVRSVDALKKMLAADPYDRFQLPRDAKRIVTFLREPSPIKLDLPIERDGASILVQEERDIFSAYRPTPKGPVFMTLIEKTFGKEVTTRTWDMVTKVAR